MRKYKFTVHAEFELDESEVWPDDWDTRTDDEKDPSVALQELLRYSTAGVCDTLLEWNVIIPDTAVNVEEVIDPLAEKPLPTGAWNFHD